MKYILLDTNIVIDMVVDRKNQVSSDLLKSFIKLLDYDQIKLVLPKIVEHETYIHLEEELNKVGKNIETAMDKIKNLYGVQGYTIAGLDMQDYKKQSRNHLNEALKVFQEGKEKYKEELFNVVKMVFEHKNCIRIEDDEFLNVSVIRRKIYKRAPFHKEQKESYADSLIIETLINIRKYIEIGNDDIVYFVTGNYKDFSETDKDKDSLHHQIIEDLRNKGIYGQIRYIRQFARLIQEELKNDVQEAKLSEEFQRELEQEEEEERLLLERDYEDSIRESAGLSALGDFEDKLQENLADSGFQHSLSQIFERITKSYGTLDEFLMFYDEDISNCIGNSNIDNIGSILDIFSKLFENIEEQYFVENNISGLQEVMEWIGNQKFILKEIPYDDYLPDYIDFGDCIKLYDYKRRKIYLYLDDLYISPSNGSSDQIDIYVKNSDDQKCAEGYISVTYGFIEYDEDGGAADGCEEDINFCCQEIIDYLDGIASEWEEFIKEQEKIVEYLKKSFSLS